ncbi:uncharacterized protein MKK02DRAFT_45070 [Dioszegia hungarica]|uniref:K Homology domain-containing protein n=1 Tax=Dioszegia hungarica TaxID=4972 RepID=A0AA38H9M4_9TREE|nr:uncharacterized protein MKK02DRAFT_45070 [Dioszegia hungarica]KAI9636363.1 hypothetical protein MKK02DRAFT_45070 [Dioszegia hungarica]
MADRASRWDAPSSSSSAAPAAAGGSTPDTKPSDAAITAAAAIAAKIAASLRPGVAGNELMRREKEEGDFVRDIEINDLRNRYLLTKGPTQKQIEEETGAVITTKGVWIPDRSKLMPGETPLYLHIVANSQVVLDNAVAKVNELIDQDLGPLLDPRTMAARNRALGLPPPEGWLPGGRVKWPEAKLPIGLESLRNFNVRAKTVGPGGMFVKYIQAETGARVQIKGMGSGFMEADTGREAEEPMHINVAAPNQDQVDRARQLAEDLLVVLRIEYQKARDGTAGGGAPGVYQPGSGSYAATNNGPDYAAYYQQQAQAQYQPTPPQAGQTPAVGGQTPAGGAGAGQVMPQPGTEAYAQFAAYWAQYGYSVEDQQFKDWFASQYGQQVPAAQ